jgi:hypothetical protein
MSQLNIPNALANGIPADGNNLDANFDAIQAWADDHAAELDGATFTGDVFLNGAPTTDLQAATKAYVDSTITAHTVATAQIENDAVTQDKLADDSVGAAQIIDDAVGTAAIADDAVTQAQLADDSVGTAQIIDDSVGTDAIADNCITTDHISPGHFLDIKNTKPTDYCGKITATTPQTLAAGVAENITFDSEEFDVGAMHSTSSNTDRVTAVVAGYMHFDASIPFDTNASGYRIVVIKKYNSGGVFQSNVALAALDAGDVGACWVHCSGMTFMAAGDYVVVEVTSVTASLDTAASLGIVPMLSWHCVRLT